MKIAVIGGTGLIGSQVVKILDASGHEAVPHSPSTGVDLLSGQGLPAALKGADVVVNVTNSPTFDDASLTFFRTTMDNLLAAAAAAGVGHAVILSVSRRIRSSAPPSSSSSSRRHCPGPPTGTPSGCPLRSSSPSPRLTRGDHRTVITDDSAGLFAAASGDALTAKDGAVIAKTTYREWLAR